MTNNILIMLNCEIISYGKTSEGLYICPAMNIDVS